MAWRIADASLAVVLLIGVLVAGNLEHMPRGAAQFLAMRVSLKNALLLTGFAIAWPGLLGMFGVYAPNRLHTGKGEWSRLAIAAFLASALALAFPITSVSGLIKPVHVAVFGVVLLVAERLMRSAVRLVEHRRAVAEPRQVVLVGSGPLAKRLYNQLLAEPLRKVSVIGFVDTFPHAAMAGLGAAYLGNVADLEHILMRRVVDDVFIGLPVKSCYDEIRASLTACARVGVRASYSADLFGAPALNLRGDGDHNSVLSTAHGPRAELLAIKRTFDIIGAVALLVCLAPVMIVVSLLIKLTSNGPVLFSQDRYGYMKRLFRMYKFRTMVSDAEEMQSQLEHKNEATGPVFKIRNDPRVTPVGRVLRRTSLDELPQLWNVITGEMSLVGPRPLPKRDVGKFDDPSLMRRFTVRPGLTCLWQVRGRSNTDFNQWIALDLEYIDRWSLLLDAQILYETIPAVVRGRGAV
jgi:exopolysaccharide biosynthesis polyprenyl glycosylphosphotransferase